MTTRDTQPKRLPRRRARLIAAVVSAAAVCVPNGSRAQELATGFEIEERPIQKVPTTFKFQSRISQAKMPVGSQTFTTLYVNLVRGNSDVLCSEQLNQVQVRDSVLNIEIGRGFNCPLDDIIATNNDLNFQICIQSKENCLKPIALSSVPYAIKATFSQQAQEAHTADIAAQCHYAHRVTADTGLLSVNSQSQHGYGYYDFATPIAPNALSSLAMPTGVTNASGFLQWTPVHASAQRDLTVCSRTHNGSALAKLDVFNVQASNSYFSDAVYVGTESMHGYLQVDGHTHIIGDADAENGTMRTDLAVGRDAQIGRDLDVGQDVRVGRDADVGQDIRVARNAHVAGDMDATNGTLRNDLTVRRDAYVQRHAHVTGDMDATNGTLRNDLTVQRDAYVRRDAHITGDQDATNGKYRAALAVDGSISITGTAGTGGLTAAGDVSARSGIFSQNVSAINGTFSGDVSARHTTLTGNLTAADGIVRGDRLVSDSSVTAVTVTATGHVSAGSLTATGHVQAATMGASGQLSSGALTTTNATVTARLLVGNGSDTGFEVTASGQVIFYDAPQFPNGVVFPAASHTHLPGDIVGTLSADQIPFLDASKLATGTLNADRVPGLDASKLATGMLNADRVPGLDASKLATGTLNAARLPGLDASKIATGTLSTSVLPNLDASKIATGTLSTSVLPNLDASKIATGTLASDRVPALDASKIATGTLSPARYGSDIPMNKVKSTGEFSLESYDETAKTAAIPAGTRVCMLTYMYVRAIGGYCASAYSNQMAAKNAQCYFVCF